MSLVILRLGLNGLIFDFFIPEYRYILIAHCLQPAVLRDNDAGSIKLDGTGDTLLTKSKKRSLCFN